VQVGTSRASPSKSTMDSVVSLSIAVVLGEDV